MNGYLEKYNAELDEAIEKIEESPSRPVIHYCGWSSQPDICIACGKWTTPKWNNKQEPLFKHVYLDDEDELYTFEKKLVTCGDCLKLIKDGYKGPYP